MAATANNAAMGSEAMARRVDRVMASSVATRRLRPPLLLHGHIHPDDQPIGVHRLGHTIVRNVVGRHLLDIDPGAGARSPAGARHAS